MYLFTITFELPLHMAHDPIPASPVTSGCEQSHSRFHLTSTAYFSSSTASHVNAAKIVNQSSFSSHLATAITNARLFLSKLLNLIRCDDLHQAS
jgi:hypothetical protein